MFAPLTSVTTAITLATPITTPSSVSTVRILFAHSDCTASINASLSSIAPNLTYKPQAAPAFDSFIVHPREVRVRHSFIRSTPPIRSPNPEVIPRICRCRCPSSSTPNTLVILSAAKTPVFCRCRFWHDGTPRLQPWVSPAPARIRASAPGVCTFSGLLCLSLAA